MFNEAVKKCCYSDEDCKIAFVGVSNYTKFLDRYVWANSGDPDQTAPSGAV